MSSQIQAQKAPSLKIPSSTKTCQLSIINTTCDLVVPTNYLLTPTIDNYEWMNLPTYSFHIKHESSGKEVLFDLGCRKDWENSVPHIAEMISKRVNGLKIARDVVDTLADGNVKVENLSAFILSHWHYDHNGDVSRLPRSTDLIVGPGFKDKFCPGYPAKEDSPFWDADFEGRNVVEPRFSDDFKIGKFQAHDYFGDGSLYVLNVPGHTTGHISALVRTTPDTFVFLGGDVCHFGGVMRPTPYIPLPDEIPEETPLEKRIARPCPCTAFLSCHPKGEVDGRTSPFFEVSSYKEVSFYEDPQVAQTSVRALIEFDADSNVLVAIAHDPTSLDVFDFFPTGTMNDWRAKGWKEQQHWGFLNELPYNGKVIRSPLVDGLYNKQEEKLRGLEV